MLHAEVCALISIKSMTLIIKLLKSHADTYMHETLKNKTSFYTKRIFCIFYSIILHHITV